MIVSLVSRPAPADRATVQRVPGPEAGHTVATVDVFETVLVRSVSPHQAVFDRVGERARAGGLVACSPYAFAQAREAAERRAQRRRGDATTLADIYAELARTLSLCDRAAAKLADLEMDTEACLLRPAPAALPLLAGVRREAGRLAFVSDMYLPAPFIKRELQRHGIWQAGDALYVSNTHGQTKRTGRLFEIVAEAEGVPVGSLRHYGNSWAADVEGARRAGAEAVFLDDGNPNRFERVLHRHRHGTDGLAASMAGASRLARLAWAPETAHDRAVVGVAAGVAAPVLVAYVLWLLQRAEALGLRRLYFVSRDGQVLHRIAVRLAERLGTDVDLRYLYGSRLAWNRAVACPTQTPEVWRSLMWKSSGLATNRDLLERLGLGAETTARVVADSGADEAAWGSTTDRSPLRSALDAVRADGTLATAQDDHKRLLLRYLDGEGLLDDVPHAFVDVGWRGTQHDVLVRLQTERGVRPAHGLFFGLEDSDSPDIPHDAREAFLVDARGPEGDEVDKGVFSLVEVFCTGDHGSVVGYAEDGDRVVPVLAAGPAPAVDWGLPLVWDTIDAFVDAFDAPRALAGYADVRPALWDLVRALWDTPALGEAEAWGSFPWERGQGRHTVVVPFAPPLQFTVVARRARSTPRLLLRPGALVLRAFATEWPAATRVRSRGLMRAAYAPRSTGASLRRRAGRALAQAARVLG